MPFRLFLRFKTNDGESSPWVGPFYSLRFVAGRVEGGQDEESAVCLANYWKDGNLYQRADGSFWHSIEVAAGSLW